MHNPVTGLLTYCGRALTKELRLHITEESEAGGPLTLLHYYYVMLLLLEEPSSN